MQRLASLAIAGSLAITATAFAADGQPISGQIQDVDLGHSKMRVAVKGHRWIDLKWNGIGSLDQSFLEGAQPGQEVFVTARKAGRDEWHVISVQSVN